jgi:hypothetical protein
MAKRKNTPKQDPRPRIRTSRPIDNDSDVAAFQKKLRTLCEILATVPEDDPNPEAANDAVNRWCLNRVLEAVAPSGDEDIMRTAAPALEALSEGPLSYTACTFLDQVCSHLPDPGQLGRQG